MPPMSQRAGLRSPTAFTPSDLLRVLGHEMRTIYGTRCGEPLPRDLSDLVERLGRQEGFAAPAAKATSAELPLSPLDPYLEAA